ncbi:MAG: acyl-CoA carboxylase subunit epsilon [Rhodoluna sp.]|jgi:hypothetical protein|nr:acyl-CoA carboxylase subunit epsilon [Rhodoluna sp.]
MSNEENIAETIKVVAGNPTAIELAAVIAILEAQYSELAPSKKLLAKPASAWNRNGADLRSQLSPGLAQWQAQFRPGMD